LEQIVRASDFTLVALVVLALLSLLGGWLLKRADARKQLADQAPQAVEVSVASRPKGFSLAAPA
jgi:cytochrome oxidase assembly protein ShyY1